VENPVWTPSEQARFWRASGAGWGEEERELDALDRCQKIRGWLVKRYSCYGSGFVLFELILGGVACGLLETGYYEKLDVVRHEP